MDKEKEEYRNYDYDNVCTCFYTYHGHKQHENR